jgi:hypothetical protein
MSSSLHREQMHSIGKAVFESTKYKLVSSRFIYPENFEHPSQSVQGKKELLMSLSPMLLEAESERKKETAECEHFTRCRVGKGRGKYSCYEYTDIDTGIVVDLDEYKNRYLKFIYRNRPQQETGHSHESFSVVAIEAVETELINRVESTKTSLKTDAVDVDSPDICSRKCSSRRGQARRGTLSPATARAMMLDAMEDQAVADPISLSSSVKMKDQARRGTLSPATARAILLENAPDDELNCSVESTCSSATSSIEESVTNESHISATTDNLQSMSTDSKFTEIHQFERDVSNGDPLEIESRACDQLAFAHESFNDTKTQNLALKLLHSNLFCLDSLATSNNLIETDSPCEGKSRVDRELKAFYCDQSAFSRRTTKGPIGDEESASIAQQLAEYRLKLRNEQIIWKYHWEVASIDAAKVAFKKFSS